MKKHWGVLFLLAACAAAVQAQPQTRLHEMMRTRPLAQQTLVDNIRFAPAVNLNKEDQFGHTPVFAAALKGDVRAISFLRSVAQNGDYLLRTGKDGNNVLHVARDLKTFEALLKSLRHFYPQDYKARVNLLLEQKNHLKETSLRAQLNYGKTDIFLKYFPRTDLYARLVRVQAKLAQGGLVAQVAEYEKSAVVEESKDLSGLTPAEAARQNASRPGMRAVAAFFAENAPFL